MKNDLDFIKDKLDQSGINAPQEMDRDYVLDQLEGVEPQPTLTEVKPKKHTAAVISGIAAAVVLVAALSVVLGTHLMQIPVGIVEAIKPHATEAGQDVTVSDNSYVDGLKAVKLSGGLTLRQFSSYQEVNEVLDEINNRRSYLDRIVYGDDEYDVNISNISDDGLTSDFAAAEDSAAYGGSGSGSTGSSSNTADKSQALTGSAAGAGAGAGADNAHSDTYKQVEGVDEADIIKTDGRYIYCVNYYAGQGIVIFSAEGEESRRVATIDVNDSIYHTATPDETEYDYYYGNNNASVQDIFLHGDRLIALCTDYYGYSYGGNTVALVYDISDINNIRRVDQMTQSGTYTSSRMIGDILYTVSSNTYAQPLCGRGNVPDLMPADCIYTLENPTDDSFVVVSAFNVTDSSSQIEQKAILGGAETVYCSPQNLYIAVTGWNDYLYYNAAEDDIAWPSWYSNKSQILKVSLADGLAFTAYTEVEGYVNDQYSLDESDGYLRVATTSTGDDYQDINNLFILDGDLGMVGSVTGFAENEHIEAVRYVGTTAYVITYEQTDPLFVIDLSNPAAPEILGSVKISGFSTMLVPIDENTVLGLGIHTAEEDYIDMEVQEGFKLALFDVSDKSNPRVLDSIAYPDCYSAVMYNPKALVYNAERGDFVIPLNSNERTDVQDEYGYYDYRYHGGMLNFAVRDGKLVEEGRYISDQADNTERCVYVGDDIYMTYYKTDYYGGSLQLESVKYPSI